MTVFEIVAPLLECDYDDDFAALDAYHGGIGIINNSTGYTITLNYDAYPSFTEAILPQVITLPNGTKDLQWSNQGRVFIYAGINTSYWYTAMDQMAVINGNQFNSYISWIKSYNASFPWYNIWSVYDDWPGNMLLPNHECFNFIWESLTFLHGQGVTIIPAKARTSFIALFASQKPTKVDYNDPTVRSNIISFYEDMNDELNELGLLGFMDILMQMVFYPTFYVRDNNDYYQLDLWDPWVGTLYVKVPTPGH
uniref:Uncharacterized protein n=1 Tax=Arcella intermedia TaxID=1963864 RepID=A0A6B2LFK7_9EUKA